MSKKQACVYFYTSYCNKMHQIHNSDIFQYKIWIPDKKNLFATLFSINAINSLNINQLMKMNIFIVTFFKVTLQPKLCFALVKKKN